MCYLVWFLLVVGAMGITMIVAGISGSTQLVLIGSIVLGLVAIATAIFLCVFCCKRAQPAVIPGIPIGIQTNFLECVDGVPV